MKQQVLAQILSLKSMTGEELRNVWKELYTTEPPRINKYYLVKRLTYRIQEIAYGGSQEVEERLAAKAKEYFGRGKKPTRTKKRAITGSVLVRVYHDVEHQVAVLEDGYQYRGCKYRSLSAIAKHITGMSWSGNAFFGLNKKLGAIDEEHRA